jgi:hypothetical protein
VTAHVLACPGCGASAVEVEQPPALTPGQMVVSCAHAVKPQWMPVARATQLQEGAERYRAHLRSYAETKERP